MMLDTHDFDNRFSRELPADPQVTNFRRQVHGACYSRVVPTPVAAPRLIAYAREVAELLDITPAACESAEFVQVFSGNKLLHGMDPFAMCYGGHQFGHWAGQLGDGRAIILGETVNRAGQRLALQLKGAGPTPYWPYAEIKKYSIKSRCSAAHRGVDAAQQILCRRYAAFPKRFGAEQLMTAFDHIAEYAQDGFSMNRRLAELMPKGEDAFRTAA